MVWEILHNQDELRLLSGYFWSIRLPNPPGFSYPDSTEDIRPVFLEKNLVPTLEPAIRRISSAFGGKHIFDQFFFLVLYLILILTTSYLTLSPLHRSKINLASCLNPQEVSLGPQPTQKIPTHRLKLINLKLATPQLQLIVYQQATCGNTSSSYLKKSLISVDL